ncbi:MAG: hypothetical protein QOC63_2958 [Mycobacterium sp.]|nr:hypothetical protein [Mycobacterium sp.]
MGRVNRLTERRHLRRAAEEALMTPAFPARPLDASVGTPSSAGPSDTREDADYPDPWGDDWDTNGHEPVDAITEPITEPIAVAALQDRLRSARDDVWPADVPAAGGPASAPIGTWNPDLIELRQIRVVQPWYRTKAATATLTAAALAAVAIVVSSVLLVSRSGGQAASVTPEASTVASPPPSSAQPAPRAPGASSSAPAPPPPPPPVPSATPDSPPPVWRNPDSGSPSHPSTTKKPEIGVTRSSMSVAPPPPPPTVNNSATPGRHHQGFF